MTETDTQTILQGIQGINQRLDKVDQRLDNVDSRLGNVDRRLDSIETRLNIIDKDLTDLKDEVKTWSGRIFNIYNGAFISIALGILLYVITKAVQL